MLARVELARGATAGARAAATALQELLPQLAARRGLPYSTVPACGHGPSAPGLTR